MTTYSTVLEMCVNILGVLQKQGNCRLSIYTLAGFGCLTYSHKLTKLFKNCLESCNIDYTRNNEVFCFFEKSTQWESKKLTISFKEIKK